MTVNSPYEECNGNTDSTHTDYLISIKFYDWPVFLAAECNAVLPQIVCRRSDIEKIHNYRFNLTNISL